MSASTSDRSTEKYFRMVYIIGNSCTRVLRKMVEQQMAADKPPNNQPLPFKQFLQEREKIHYVKKEGNKKLSDMIDSDISKCDVSALAKVLLKLCIFTLPINSDIETIKSIRDEVLHTPYTCLGNYEYQSKMTRIDASVNRLCVHINDKEFTEEIDKLNKVAENDSFFHDEYLIQLTEDHRNMTSILTAIVEKINTPS